jgi:DNA (cytosine-5)-methyltransferase 1
MDLSKLSKEQLFIKCDELGIKKYRSKNKATLISLIEETFTKEENIVIKSIITPPQTQHIDTNVNITDNSKFKLVDLFAGTGAFSYAFHYTNKVETVFANDMLDSSEKIFNLNNTLYLTNKNLIDISLNEIPRHNILTGGFPCQPFSIAGTQKGFDDERSNVFWKILSILEAHSPEIVILENVKNLQSHDNGNTFKIIIENLEKLGYNIKYAILNTSKITSVPQNRERIYIVCFKNIELYNKFDFNFDEVENEPITNFLEENVPEKYYYKTDSFIYDTLKKAVTNHISTNTIYQYRRYYVRENKNSVCPTLTANMGTGGHNVPIILDDKGIRKLTPRECFNLQGFPSDYKLPIMTDGKNYSLAGNAVSVPVVKLLASKIMSLFKNFRKKIQNNIKILN